MSTKPTNTKKVSEDLTPTKVEETIVAPIEETPEVEVERVWPVSTPK